MNRLRHWIAAAALMIGFSVAAGGCKKGGSTPSPETDPEKLKQVEEKVQDAAKQEGKALNQQLVE